MRHNKTISRNIRTINHEGGTAFKISDELNLYTQVCTCLFNEKKFYGDKETQADELVKLVRKVAAKNPSYVANLAAYARNKMNLRSVSVMLLVELANAKEAKGTSLIRSTVPNVVKRADEIAEVMAYQIVTFGRTKIPNGLKRGLADCFHKFDEYQFAKYDRDGTVKLRDVLRMVHPKPSPIFKSIKERTLPVPDTWEVVISTKGSTKENWESIMPKMGIFAKVRNLRNFIKKGCDVGPVVSDLLNPNIISRSRMLPFRFYSAYRELDKTNNPEPKMNKVMDALSEALELSVSNLPVLSGDSMVAVDLSGSMESYPSDKSTITMKEIGAVMGAIAVKTCSNAVVYGFGDEKEVIRVPKKTPLLESVAKIEGTDVGSSTNGYLVLADMIARKVSVDRLMFFTDCQLYGETSYNQSFAALWNKYRSVINPKARLYIFDLCGYGTGLVHETAPGATTLSGWSERVFDFLHAYEQDGEEAVKLIMEGRFGEAELNGDMYDKA